MVSAIVLVSFRDIYSWLIVDFSAYISYLSLSPFGADITGNVISLGSKAINYVEACAAVGAYGLLAILILLTKDVGLKKSVKMFIHGAILILIANIIRIDILAYLLVNENINLFLTLHMIMWKLLSGIYVALVWIYLIRKYHIEEIPIIGDFKELLNRSNLRPASQ